jgi:hypothetical protein
VIPLADEFRAPREFIEHAGIRRARARREFHDEFHRRGMQFSVSRRASPILENINDGDDDDGDVLFRSRACEHRKHRRGIRLDLKRECVVQPHTDIRSDLLTVMDDGSLTAEHQARSPCENLAAILQTRIEFARWISRANITSGSHSLHSRPLPNRFARGAVTF